MSYVLQLYIAGTSTLSINATKNLSRLVKKFLNEQEDNIEIIDIMASPAIAFEKRIIITPTLIRVQPSPLLRIVGDLSDIDNVAVELGLIK